MFKEINFFSENKIYFLCFIILILSILPQFIFGNLPSKQVIVFFIFMTILSLVSPYILRKEILYFLEKKATKILIVFVLFYAILFCFLVLFWFDNFLFLGHDIITFSEALRTTISESLPFYARIRNISIFGFHNYLFIWFLIPIFLIFPHPKTLLILKVICLSLSVIPLYFIVCFKNSKFASLLLSIGFLLALPIISQMTFEWYELTFFPLIFFLTYYFWQRENFLGYIVSLLICLSLREEISAIVFMYGIYSFLKRRSLKWILYPIIFALLWGVFSYKIVIPLFSKETISPYINFIFRDFLNVKLTSFISYAHLSYLYWLIGPLFFILPFLSLEWLLSFLILFGSLYTTYPVAKCITHHYQLTILPALFISVNNGIDFLSRNLFKKIDPQMIKTIFCLSVLILNATFTGAYKINEILFYKRTTSTEPKIIREAIKLIPKDASVIAPRYIGIHLIDRKSIFIALNHPDWYGFFADYLIVDENTNDLFTKKYINEQTKEIILKTNIYKKIYEYKGLKVYKRSYIKKEEKQ